LGKILITGGGTGGHVYPAIALAKAAEKAGHKVLMVGSRGRLEETEVPQHGIKIKFIDSGQFIGKSLAQKIRSVMLLPRGVSQSMKIINDFRPDAVIGVGGYVTVPMIAAAKIRGVRTVLYETNGYPGLANRIFSPFANAVFTPFESFRKFFPSNNTHVAAVATHPEKLEQVRRAEKDGKFTVLVMGGSQGSKSINDAVSAALGHLPQNVRIVHSTGTGAKYESAMKAYRQNALANGGKSEHVVTEFISNVPKAMDAADLVVSRAGTTTIIEAGRMGKPLVLVPGHYKAGHTESVAQAFEDSGSAFVIRDQDFTTEKFLQTLRWLMISPEKMRELAQNLKGQVPQQDGAPLIIEEAMKGIRPRA
jgi:UDP-N-acetylglucosamine--N-acetylmuramyl-(pentapeptide) pyrophosphoryl-undecaprenol N-acetylglucosamine transferase